MKKINSKVENLISGLGEFIQEEENLMPIGTEDDTELDFEMHEPDYELTDLGFKQKGVKKAG
ncbi:MAG TPA: hypothetical protein VH878_04370, partial [Thermodesulfobacteriota bacterium]